MERFSKLAICCMALLVASSEPLPCRAQGRRRRHSLRLPARYRRRVRSRRRRPVRRRCRRPPAQPDAGTAPGAIPREASAGQICRPRCLR